MKKAKVNKKSKTYLYYFLKLCSQITYFFYLVSDHIIYFEKFIQRNPGLLNFSVWINDVFWFIQECFDFLSNGMDFFDSLKLKRNIKVALLKVLINIMNGLAALGFFSGLFPRYFNVLMGFITTLIWWYIFLQK